MGEAASQMGGSLPTALAVGRSSVAGPQTGGYVSFGLSAYNKGVAVVTDDIAYAIEMPMDFRVEAISWSCRTEAGACSFQVAKAAALAWSAETDLISADVACVTDTGALLLAGTTPNLVAAARNIDKGEFLMVGFTSNATGTILDLNVEIIGYCRGHINADPAND